MDSGYHSSVYNAIFFNYFMFRFSSVSVSLSVTSIMFHFVSNVLSFDTCIFVKCCVNF